MRRRSAGSIETATPGSQRRAPAAAITTTVAGHACTRSARTLTSIVTIRTGPVKGTPAVTSPHATNLLNEHVDTTTQLAPQHVRSVTHVVPQPMMVMAYPQPALAQEAAPTRGGSGAVSTLALALVVILLGAITLVGAYYAARQAAPSAREAGLTQGMAMRQGFQSGRERGIVDGRTQALQGSSTTTALRVAQAREQAWAAAYRRGERAGRRSYRAPQYTNGGYSYRSPRYRGVRNADLYSAFGTAQSLANATGAAVDLEVY